MVTMRKWPAKKLRKSTDFQPTRSTRAAELGALHASPARVTAPERSKPF